MNIYELYQFNSCPFCVKVKQALVELNIDVAMVDVRLHPEKRQEMIEHGGKSQVPCLKISSDNQTQWLYESDDIIEYLTQKSAA